MYPDSMISSQSTALYAAVLPVGSLSRMILIGWTLLAIGDLLVIMCSLFEQGNHLNAAPVVLGGAHQNIDLSMCRDRWTSFNYPHPPSSRISAPSFTMQSIRNKIQPELMTS
ncbi:hypothetical protein PGT21_008785 [Puccinia graminis f. sp. tritici]|uniref:Uncharacterized protein n=1 Tax=Puccinia graminis f. sp. tritici TaxID=56615 RepID=A0A5B0PNE1_PUCGR|nr:hypothetical protein PGT21_008785 [Puccinia graminis f. sp. tritici]